MNLRLFRNAWSNLLGAAVPALAALATVPLVVAGLGQAGYGLYALVTAIVGYFAVIDINVTAGSVKFIAAQHARGEHGRVAETLCFGLAVYAGIGALGALGLYASAGLLVARVFAVPDALQAEALACLRLAALGFLLGQLQSYLNSVPQALMRYELSSRLEMVFGTLVPLLTVAVLLLGQGLFEVIALRVAASGVHCLLLWRGVQRTLPGLRLRWPGLALRRGILGFSAYSFLSRFAALSYAHADKLIIGALVGVAGLAYFTVAATLANRVLGLSLRLSAVFFPAASALAASGELARLEHAYLKATRYVAYLNAAMLVLLGVFAYPLLAWWMGAGFARAGATVLALVALSQFVDSLTNLPSLVNDGMGHPRLSGLFALGRALAGLPVVYLGVAGWGIEGAAWGHLAASIVFTAAFLAVVHGRTVPARLARVCTQAYLPGFGAAALAALAAAPLAGFAGRGGFALALALAATAGLLAVLGMVLVLEGEDRRWAWAQFRTQVRAQFRAGEEARVRVLLVSEDLPGEQLGGLARHVVTLGNALLACGHEASILGRSDRSDRSEGGEGGARQTGFAGPFLPGFDYAHPGWKESQLGVFNPFKRPYFARKIARAIERRAGGADVVHYHGHLPMVGLYLDRSINFVQTRHDQGSECMIHLRFRDGAVCGALDARACAGCAHPQPGPLRTMVSAHAVSRYRLDAARAFARHKTIFVSDFLRRQFLRALPGADLARSRVIHNFVDYGKLAAIAAQAGPPRAGQVLVAGRIDSGKGFGEFLAALQGRLPPGARVLVAGDGPQQAGLAARFAGEQLRFLGWRANPEVVALAATSHACVVPSVLEEPCGTTILEALALGRPCLALARGGNPELDRYAAYPGQLALSATMDGLADLLLAELARPPGTAPLPPTAAMDVFQALPRILDFYANAS